MTEQTDQIEQNVETDIASESIIEREAALEVQNAPTPPPVDPLVAILSALSQSKGFVAISMSPNNTYQYHTLGFDIPHSYYATALLKKTLDKAMG